MGKIFLRNHLIPINHKLISVETRFILIIQSPLFEKEGLGGILLDKSPSIPREVNNYDLSRLNDNPWVFGCRDAINRDAINRVSTVTIPVYCGSCVVGRNKTTQACPELVEGRSAWWRFRHTRA